jgi:hypothetical protein
MPYLISIQQIGSGIERTSGPTKITNVTEYKEIM